MAYRSYWPMPCYLLPLLHFKLNPIGMLTSEILKSAIAKARVSKGKNKGMLKAKCPPVNTPEAAAWLAIMSHVNPYKVGIAQMLFMDKTNRSIFEAVDKAMSSLKREQFIGLDSDRLALEAIGAW